MSVLFFISIFFSGLLEWEIIIVWKAENVPMLKETICPISKKVIFLKNGVIHFIIIQSNI